MRSIKEGETMKKIICACLLTLYSLHTTNSYAECKKPTNYKTYYSYTIYYATPKDQPNALYLVLTKTPRGLFGGAPHRRKKNEPLIHFEQYKKPLDKSNTKIACVDYGDFIKAINSDQPAHNIRIPSGEQYITLSKIIAREFRNGHAQKGLERIIHQA